MAQKSEKKPTAKTTTAKKTAVKKTGAAKTAAAKKTVATPVQQPDVRVCGCGHDCKCGGECRCDAHAHKCGGGCKFGRFITKLIFALIIFALGFAAAKMCCSDCPYKRGPHAEFVNGCLNSTSVQCPKMLAALPMMDVNADNCISRAEYREFNRQIRREMRDEMDD